MTFTFQTFSPWLRGTFTFTDIYIWQAGLKQHYFWGHCITHKTLSISLVTAAMQQDTYSINHTKTMLLITQLSQRPKPAPLFKDAHICLFHPAVYPHVHLLHPAVWKIEESSYIVLQKRVTLVLNLPQIFMEAPFNTSGFPTRWIEYLNHAFIYY